MHGSVAPKLVLPLFGIAGWATLLTVISERLHESKSTIILFHLGFWLTFSESRFIRSS